MNEWTDLQEHIFVVVMLGLVFLYRESPNLQYPQVLYLLLALLGHNFFQHWYLRRASRPKTFHAFSLVLNILLIAGILRFSGGKDSYLWVLLLLPIFSSLLLQEVRTLWLTLALALTVLLANYNDIDWPWALADADLFSLSTKIAVLTLALVATKRFALAERTAKTRLEEDRKSLKQIETHAMSLQADKMYTLGQLATSIAHDLNAPIGVIMGYCDLLLTNLPPDSPHASDAQRIRKASEFCRDLIANVLAMARREDYRLVPTSIPEVYEDAWSLCKTRFRAREVSMDVRFEEDLPKALVSPIHIQQVLLNLMTNACDVSPSGKAVQVDARRIAKNGGIEISVRDRGPGIPKENLAKIFEPFFTTKAAGQGTGMGLYIVQQIIERHRGRISAANAPEGGAVFTFTLPSK